MKRWNATAYKHFTGTIRHTTNAATRCYSYFSFFDAGGGGINP